MSEAAEALTGRIPQILTKDLTEIKTAAASEDSNGLGIWARTDIIAYFQSEDNSFKIFRFSKALPGLVVFLPILWTWICLSAASVAFTSWSSSRQATIGSTPSFIDLWHTGFGGHLSRIFWFDRFTEGAVLVSALVAVVLFVDAGRGEPSTQLSRETYRLLLHLEAALEPFRSQDLLVAAKMSGAIDKINDVALHFENASEVLSETGSRLSTTLEHLEVKIDDVYERLGGISSKTNEQQTLIEARIKNLLASIEKLNEKSNEFIGIQLRTLEELNDQLLNIRNEERHTVWDAVSTIALNSTNSFDNFTEGVLQSFEAMVSMRTQVMESVTNSAAAVEETAKIQKALVERLQDISEKVVDHLGKSLSRLQAK